MFKTIAAVATLTLAATPVLASPAKPLPVQSCNAVDTYQGQHHGADRPCSPASVASTAVTAPVAPRELAILSITPTDAGVLVRATDDEAVSYVSLTWRNEKGRAASCIVQSAVGGGRVAPGAGLHSGTVQDGMYLCKPSGEQRDRFVLSGTYALHGVYVNDAKTRRTYAKTVFNGTFTR